MQSNKMMPFSRRYTAVVLTLLLGSFTSMSPDFALANSPVADKKIDVVTRLDFPGFEEPLFAIDTPSDDETAALKKAVKQYMAQANYSGVSILEAYLKQYPNSAWRVALQTNLGLIYYKNGAFSSAISAWEDAWKLGSSATGVQEKAMVDRAYGELARMHARIGHADRIAELLEEGKGRTLVGPATEAITGAKEGLWVMRNDPGIAYLCGPRALRSVLEVTNPDDKLLAELDKARSGTHGFNLKQVNDLAKQLNMPYQMAKRVGNAPLPFPVVTHWKVNHYAAVLGFKNNLYHVRDPIFGDDLWVPAEVLDKESDGYFLIPENKMGKGWQQVATADAEKVYGMGYVTAGDPGRTGCGDNKNSGTDSCSCECPGPVGMPKYDVHSMLVSLNITDSPVGYRPPVGPAVYTTLTYNQREAGQPSNPSSASVGPKWTMNWLSYIADVPDQPGADVTRYVSGGGSVKYTNYDSATGAYKVEPMQGATLVLTSTSPVSYERRLKNGNKEIYSKSDGATGSSARRVFLKKVIDRAGNTLTLNYDSSNRVISVADALGQLTTFTYGNANIYLITQITDPFSRTAQLSYDASNRLKTITDAVGMTSLFTYNDSPTATAPAVDFITSMTTPYGTTIFETAEYGDPENPSDPFYTAPPYFNAATSRSRQLVITDPMGEKERTEFLNDRSISQADNNVPSGSISGYSSLHLRYTLYWDKHNYAKNVKGNELQPDYSTAEIKHWLNSGNTTSGVMKSIKKPLESRVWFNYPGQTGNTVGTSEQPTYIGRVLDDGSSQYTQMSRNSLGKMTCKVDPMGTAMFYNYASNQMDLQTVYRKANGSCGDQYDAQLIRSYVYADAANPRLPTTITDALGHSTKYTYNTYGQVKSVTNELNQVTNYAYSGGYLQTITDSNGVVVATFTYDSVGRVSTSKNAANYTLTYTYDNLNRLTRITHPDSTFVNYGYDKLDVVTITDRNGDVKTSSYDAVRNVIAQNINTNVWQADYKYYENGQPKYVIDGVGNVTANVVDDQSRVVQTQRGANGAFTLTSPPMLGNGSSHNTTYAYETNTSRLESTTDALGNITSYSYNKADQLTSVTDAKGHVTSYFYNGLGELVTQQSPDTGVTTYTYDAAGNLVTKTKGLVMVGIVPTATIDTQTISYTWDGLNRLKTINYPGTDQDVTYTYDQGTYGKGRLTQVTDAAGQTSYTYYATGDLQTKTETRGTLSLLTQYSYTPDRKLASITYPDGHIAQMAIAQGQVTDVSLALGGTSGGTALLSNITHIPFGGITGWTTNSGTVGTNQYQRSFYPNGQMSSWSLLNNGTVTDVHTLQYDDYNNIRKILYANDSGQDETYTYDDVDRLLVATGEWGRREYAYDEVGNRTQQLFQRFNSGTQTWDEVFTETYGLDPASNRLNSVTASVAGTSKTRRSFVYDARGNIIDDRHTTYMPDGTTVRTDNSLLLLPGNSDRLNNATYINR